MSFSRSKKSLHTRRHRSNTNGALNGFTSLGVEYPQEKISEKCEGSPHTATNRFKKLLKTFRICQLWFFYSFSSDPFYIFWRCVLIYGLSNSTKCKSQKIFEMSTVQCPQIFICQHKVGGRIYCLLLKQVRPLTTGTWSLS